MAAATEGDHLALARAGFEAAIGGAGFSRRRSNGTDWIVPVVTKKHGEATAEDIIWLATRVTWGGAGTITDPTGYRVCVTGADQCAAPTAALVLAEVRGWEQAAPAIEGEP